MCLRQHQREVNKQRCRAAGSPNHPQVQRQLGAYYRGINKKCVHDYLGGGRMARRGSGRGGAGVVGC